MLNYQLQELLDEYGESFTEDSQYTIDFVKNKRQELDSLNTFDDPDYFKKYLAIIGRYIKSLVDLGRYNLAIDEGNSLMPLIEESRAILAIQASEITWYLTIRFQKALAHFKLKDYKVALQEFKELQKFDSQSDHLKQWTEYARIGRFKQFETLVMIIAFALIIGSRVFRSYIPNLLGFILTVIGLFSGIFYLWIDYKSKKNNRKK